MAIHRIGNWPQNQQSMITDADIGNAFSENFIVPSLKWIINVVSKEMGLSLKFTPLIIYFLV